MRVGIAFVPGAGNMSRMVLALMALSLAAKIAAEALLLAHGWSDLPADVVISWQAHLLGVLAGALAAWKASPRKSPH